MSHTWDRRIVICVIRSNNQLQCLVLYAIELQREATLEGQFSKVEIFTGLQADRDIRGPAITRRSPRLTPILERLRGGIPPFRDYCNERARTLLPHLARNLLHDANTVLEVN